jgi:hypothetical protein
MTATSQFRAVPEAELDAMLDQPFHPPVFTEAFTRDQYRSEYWTAHSAVTAALSILGTQDQIGDGDFCANDDYGDSRFIGIELSSQRLWRPELVPLVQTALAQQPQPYCVYFEHALYDEPHFYFLVHPSSVVGYFPTAAQRRAFGL